jgi:hypothetical protein
LTFAAALDALVHVADILATVRACFADFCAGFAVVGMVITVATHEVDARGTGGDTVEHHLDVILADVVAAFR